VAILGWRAAGVADHIRLVRVSNTRSLQWLVLWTAPEYN
jgi:hypothetical protein